MVFKGGDWEREVANAYSCMFVNVFMKLRTTQGRRKQFFSGQADQLQIRLDIESLG